MEQNMPLITRKVWKMVRVAWFMLRKGISKRKLLIMDLDMMLKRGKIAGKAIIGNLLFHHHHGGATTSKGGSHLQYPTGEYEFSCSNTPLYRQYFTKRKIKNNRHAVDFEAVGKVLEMMGSNDVVEASPVLPGLGFGRSPMPVRQLRITDSPYPIQNPEEDNRVDLEAEEFINRFYSQLKLQKY